MVGSEDRVGSGPQAPPPDAGVPFFRVALKIPENILHQDHGRIYDDAEIHRAHGEQVGTFALNDQKNGGEEQRERDIQSHDGRATEIAEENPLDQEDQQASAAATKTSTQSSLRLHRGHGEESQQ